MPREQREYLFARLRAHNVECSAVPLEPLLSSGGTHDGMLLLYVGSNWEAGFDRLAQIDALVRQTAIVIGTEPPPDIGRDIRRSGGLSYLVDPPPEWLLAPLIDAIRRSFERTPLLSPGTLRELKPLTDPASANYPIIEGTLIDLAEQARSLLGADFADITLLDPVTRRYVSLRRDDRGRFTRREESEGQPGFLLPPDLSTETNRYPEPLVLPDIAHARHYEGIYDPKRTYYRGVASARIQVPGATFSFGNRHGALNLYWKRPHLPTLPEINWVELLSVIACERLGRLSDRLRYSSVSIEVIQSLDGLSTVPSASAHRSDKSVSDQRLSQIRRILDSTTRIPGVSRLWLQPSIYSRRRSPDHWLFPTEQPEAPPEPRSDTTEIADLGSDDRPQGQLVVEFEDVAAKANAPSDVKAFAVVMGYALRQVRRLADNDAILKLSSILANEDEPHQALAWMTELLKTRMRADGAKIFITRPGLTGLHVIQFCRTDMTRQDRYRQRSSPLLPNQGLSNWVIIHGRWLLIPRMASPERIGIEPEEGIAEARKGQSSFEHVKISAQSEALFGEDLPNNERTMLIVPLGPADAVTGSLVVWRETDDPFSEQGDVASMRFFAPHITSACRSVVQRELSQDRSEAIALLANHLGEQSAPANARRTVLDNVVELTHATIVVMIYRDIDAPGLLYVAEAHSKARSPEIQATLLALRDASTLLPPREDAIEAHTGRWLRQKTSHSGFPCRVRTLLRFQRAEQVGYRSEGFVALLDPMPEHQFRSGIFGEQFATAAATIFLEHVDAMLHNHLRAHAQFYAQRLAADAREARTISDVLRRAAELLREATGGDHGVAYLRNDEGQVVVASDTEAEVHAPTSKLVSGCLDGVVKNHYVLDLRRVAGTIAGQEIPRLQQACRDLDLPPPRSWLLCPIALPDGQVIGVLESVKAEGSGFHTLHRSHYEIVRDAIVEVASREIQMLLRSLMLEQLKADAEQVVTLQGEELGQAIAAKMERWASRFVRPGSRVVVVARMWADGEASVYTSEPLDLKFRDGFSNFSCMLGSDATRIDHEALGLGDRWEMAGCSVLAAPLELPRTRGPSGHLFFLHPKPFTPHLEDVAWEAARELAIILQIEHNRHIRMLEAGTFRHALRGPAQGLTSGALYLAKVAKFPKDQQQRVDRAIRTVKQEAERIRLWKDNQRLYFDETIQIQRHCHELTPLIEECIHRYHEAIIDGRTLRLELDLREQKLLQFEFDRHAVDIALSNLLENAAKYSLKNSEIVVGAGLLRPGDVLHKDEYVAHDNQWVKIWVENVGPAVPEEMHDLVYMWGHRIAWEDRLRSADGMGLGLPMVAAVARAHYGYCDHCSKPYAQPDGEFEVHQVRFWMILPLTEPNDV